MDAGVAEGRLVAQGFGEEQPIASNKTRRGRAKNRRVEFIIVDPPISKSETGGDAGDAPKEGND